MKTTFKKFGLQIQAQSNIYLWEFRRISRIWASSCSSVIFQRYCFQERRRLDRTSWLMQWPLLGNLLETNSQRRPSRCWSTDYSSKMPRKSKQWCKIQWKNSTKCKRSSKRVTIQLCEWDGRNIKKWQSIGTNDSHTYTRAFSVQFSLSRNWIALKSIWISFRPKT